MGREGPKPKQVTRLQGFADPGDDHQGLSGVPGVGEGGQVAGNPHRHRPPSRPPRAAAGGPPGAAAGKQGEKLLLKCPQQDGRGLLRQQADQPAPCSSSTLCCVRSVATGTHKETAPAGPGPRP